MSPCPCPREGLRHLTAHSWACCVPRAACGRGTFRNRALTHVLSFGVSEMSSPGDHLCAVGEGGEGRAAPKSTGSRFFSGEIQGFGVDLLTHVRSFASLLPVIPEEDTSDLTESLN